MKVKCERGNVLNNKGRGKEGKRESFSYKKHKHFCCTKKLTFCLLSFLIIFPQSLIFAAEINLQNNNYQNSSEYTVNLNRANESLQIIDLSKNDIFANLTTATDKFIQGNTRSAWEDFRTLINSAGDNDFIYIVYADKMADLGLFDLANLAFSKMKDKDITNISTNAIKKFYYPKTNLKLDDELLLAEIYSNILYNNQSFEATNELIQNAQLISSSDYANYLAALGYYKSNNFKQAEKYVNIAISKNPSTLNYQKLKAEISAELKSTESALKLVANLKKQPLNSFEYENKIAALEQFVLYKTKKSDWEQNYHLGYYYFLGNDSTKSIRALQNALFDKKRHDNGDIYGLMSQVYLGMGDFEKAFDYAHKSIKTNRENTKALTTLGDLSLKDKNYKQALSYYKKAANFDKKSCQILIQQAEVYQKLFNSKKALEIYAKILKTHSDIAEAYYNTALLTFGDKEKQITYLKKALAVNPKYSNAWVELARINMENKDFYTAQQDLSNAFYIDENDFKYYYYQGLLNVNNKDFSQAKYNFKKCLKLNGNYKQAQEALNNILKNEEGSLQVHL